LHLKYGTYILKAFGYSGSAPLAKIVCYFVPDWLLVELSRVFSKNFFKILLKRGADSVKLLNFSVAGATIAFPLLANLT